MEPDDRPSPTTGRNVELKARCADVEELERRALAIGAVPTAVLHQRDTYFAAPRGRLKLRDERREPWPGYHGDTALTAELIHYERADEATARGAPTTSCRSRTPGPCGRRSTSASARRSTS